MDRDEDLRRQDETCDVVLQDMVFNPIRPLRRFAVGLAGAFMTEDGVTWMRLLHAGALPGRPANPAASLNISYFLLVAPMDVPRPPSRKAERSQRSADRHSRCRPRRARSNAMTIGSGISSNAPAS